jgi:hypothetical protein
MTATSVGNGIEREAFHLLLEGYRSEIAKWLTPRADGYYTLTTTHTITTASFIPPSRIHAMAVFGAVVALCLVRGISAYPLDPVVLHFFTHDCNLNSIHPQLLGEWHPSLKATLSDWLSIGPDGDVGMFREHFATYHDLQVNDTLS